MTAAAPPETETDLDERHETEHTKSPKKQPPYHVVLLDDDDHSYDYVIRMLKELFGHPEERGIQLACEVDTAGRVVVATTSRERAELKRDQIHGFGPDQLIARCRGSMSALIEPAE